MLLSRLTGLVRSWCDCGGWATLLFVAMLASCQPAPPTGPPTDGALPEFAISPALRHLLHLDGSPYEATEPAALAHLHAERRLWVADPLGRLLVALRMGTYYEAQQSDSTLYYLWLAERGAARQQARYPLIAADAAGHLGSYYWRRQAYDSSRYYYKVAIGRLAHTDTTVNAPRVRTVDGETSTLGTSLAGSCANAGLSYERRGELVTAVRYYERARRLYRLHAHWSGLVWTQDLIASAYAAQGDPEKAVATYETVLATVLAYDQYPRPALPWVAAGYYATTLRDFQPLLLRADSLRHFARLIAAGEAFCAQAERRAPSKPNNVYARTLLTLSRAELLFREDSAAAIAPLMNQASQALDQLRRDGGPENWKYWRYFDQRAAWLLLRARQAHAAGRPAATLLRQAIAVLDSATNPSQRASGRLQLAAACLDAHEPATALTLLRPLVPLYRQTRNRLHLRDAYAYLARAYAATGRLDSAYRNEHALGLLNDTLRATRQYNALADLEIRYRTREKEVRIGQLTERALLERRQTRWAITSTLLLALALGGVGWGLRRSRRLNGQLAEQSHRIQEQAARLGELDEAKNQFFANVAHELRTPLTLVLGPLEGLLTDPPPDAETVRQSVGMARRHSQRLLELINRILDLTKLRAGRLITHPEPTPMAPLLRRLINSFHSLAAQRGISLHGPPVLPDELTLLVDADKLEQIITNLLANALTHTPTGGAVLVTANLLGTDDWYTLTVRDTGPGIAPDEQERVFERFYQSPQRQAQGGTGLGLSLSRELAELLGGTLTLTSEPGEGSAFTLRFRAERVAAEMRNEELGMRNENVANAPSTAAAPANSSFLIPHSSLKPRLLLVEDHADLRAYLRQLLTPAYDVLEAADGQFALEVLAHQAPVDLIVTDAMMPRLSGTELIERLKADPARCGIPVLMVTARADDAHRLAALEVGVDDYLTKPFKPNELLVRVRALLARYRVRQRYAALPAGELLAADASADGESEDADLDPLPTEPAPGAFAEVAGEEGAEEGATDGATAAVAAPPLQKALTPAAAEQLRAWRAAVAPRLPEEAFGPDDLAAVLHLSRRSLYRYLHELTGLTPAAWLRELRLDLARHLLEEAAYPTISEVAYASGFSNPSHFGKVFAERFGCRPSEYGR